MNNLSDIRYSLPPTLLTKFEDEHVHERIPVDAWCATKAFADRCEKDRSVGEWQRQPIRYDLLQRPHSVSNIFEAIPEEWRKRPDWESSGWAAIAKQKDYLSEQFDKQHGEVRLQRAAYAGWLVTNKQFIEEHDSFFVRHQATIKTHGLPILDNLPATVSAIEGSKPARGKIAALASDYTQFLGRWGLSRMAAPYLPEQSPLDQTLLPSEPPPPSIKRRSRNAKLIDVNYLKLMSPVQREAWLRLHLNSPNHLRGWATIVEAASSRRVQLQRYARLLQLHHYWFVINQNHTRELHGKIRAMTYAFARFLFPKSELHRKIETVKKDVQGLRRSLGPEWATNHSIVTSGL